MKLETTIVLVFLVVLAGAAATPEAGPVAGGPQPPGSRTRVAPAQPVPPLPSSYSPVEQFRDLLAMNAAERRRFLNGRPEESRKLILAKIREYESLRPEQRELRLQATELRWWLLPLMRTAPANREAQLKLIPPDSRELVESRLREWDKLAPSIQQELLDNEATLRYFTEMENSATNYAPAQRRKLDTGIARWQALPEERRREIARQFNQVFELSPQEQQKVLQTVSESERRQIEKTLKTFGHLPAQQRVQCIRSFEKLASLSPSEREQFLKNAERWKLMTPSEREDWRKLVAKLSGQPPLPYDALHLPAVPVPPPLSKSHKPASVATNSP